jgi:hypothetical protein
MRVRLTPNVRTRGHFWCALRFSNAGIVLVGVFSNLPLMTHTSALPFTLRRSRSIVGEEIVSTTERVHGLLRLTGDHLVIQWRVSRSVQTVGEEIRTDQELLPVREIVVPLAALAGAEVRWLWLRWPPGRYLVLTGADLRAFEEVAGAHGLQLAHPAELVLRVRLSDHMSAREFASELELAVAERVLQAAEEPLRLPGSETGATPQIERIRR